MASSKAKQGDSEQVAKRTSPTCLAVAKKGITTSQDFSTFMSSLMSDLISGAVSPGVGNAACNAGGKLLKVVEMQIRYGTASAQDGSKVLVLAMAAAPESK
jgi:hypothetical protein